ELDPLLWFDTTYLLEENSHPEAIQVLDEFLTTNAETLIRHPLKRAMFQRDLWTVFDWLAFQTEPFPVQREELKARLTKIIKRVALTEEEILSLPDNYALAVESKIFPGDFQVDQPQAAFLPSDLFQSNSAWIPIGREGGPIAMSHTNEFPFLGRSVFLVFVRHPEGRMATLDFVQSLNSEPQSARTVGIDVALVRRMLLIDDQGELVLSPLIETIQLRHFNPEQIFHEFELDRRRIINGNADTFKLKTHLFMLFFSHGDVFERDHGPELQATIPNICKACHLNDPPLPNYGNTQSIISVSRSNFPLPNKEAPILRPISWPDEVQLVIEWKHNHNTWQTLETLWSQETP
ncbi:MAG TPA: hypothetical protein VJM08_05965, partial [Anaerolineales bacterium]|nr:hypothetical protein [Anaerolineales bacterium]